MTASLLAALALTPATYGQGAATGYMEGAPDNIAPIDAEAFCDGLLISGGVVATGVVLVYAWPFVVAGGSSLATATVLDSTLLAAGMGLTVGEIIILEEAALGPATDDCLDTVIDFVMETIGDEPDDGGGQTPNAPPAGTNPNPGGSCEHPWYGLPGVLIADPTSPDGLGTYGFDPNADLPGGARSLGVVISIDCEGNIVPFRQLK